MMRRQSSQDGQTAQQYTETEYCLSYWECATMAKLATFVDDPRSKKTATKLTFPISAHLHSDSYAFKEPNLSSNGSKKRKR